MKGPSWSWSYGSWIYNYLFNQCLSPLTLWFRIPLRQGVLDKTLCDKVCQWLATCRWFSPGTPVSSTNRTDRRDITEILLKVVLSIITLTITLFMCKFRSMQYPFKLCSYDEFCINSAVTHTDKQVKYIHSAKKQKISSLTKVTPIYFDYCSYWCNSYQLKRLRQKMTENMQCNVSLCKIGPSSYFEFSIVQEKFTSYSARTIQRRVWRYQSGNPNP